MVIWAKEERACSSEVVLNKKEMTTHSSILAWEIPWTEEPGGLYSPWGGKRVRHDLRTKQQLVPTSVK